MGFLDDLAQQNSHLIEGEPSPDRPHLAKTVESYEMGTGIEKSATHHMFERIDQFVDMHQAEEAPDLWISKEGKIMRNSQEAGNEL